MQMDVQDCKILIVDDHGLSRKLLCIQLVSFGFQEDHIAACQNGIEALDLLETVHFDIVIVDWDMPLMNGLELWNKYKQVYSREGSKGAAFVMVSAEAQPDRILHALHQGIVAYITKPVSQADINDKMPKVLEWLRA